ncbi:MAG: hypothetical protein PVG67_13285, partial [Desulfobacterales bacterium]
SLSQPPYTSQVIVTLASDHVHRNAYRDPSPLDIKFRINYGRHHIGKTGNAGILASTGAYI